MSTKAVHRARAIIKFLHCPHASWTTNKSSSRGAIVVRPRLTLVRLGMSPPTLFVALFLLPQSRGGIYHWALSSKQLQLLGLRTFPSTGGAGPGAYPPPHIG